jgi:hypothetical protein
MDDPPDGFDGAVTVTADGAPARTAAATLAARFDPLAGHVVWTGRVRLDLPQGAEVTIGTRHGSARAAVTEHDVWGNARVRGLDRPPFPVELLDGAPESPG